MTTYKLLRFIYLVEYRLDKFLNNLTHCNFYFQGDMGATPLFYAIMQNSYKIVNLLYNKGAKIDVTITFEEQVCLETGQLASVYFEKLLSY